MKDYRTAGCTVNFKLTLWIRESGSVWAEAVVHVLTMFMRWLEFTDEFSVRTKGVVVCHLNKILCRVECSRRRSYNVLVSRKYYLHWLHTELQWGGPFDYSAAFGRLKQRILVRWTQKQSQARVWDCVGQRNDCNRIRCVILSPDEENRAGLKILSPDENRAGLKILSPDEENRAGLKILRPGSVKSISENSAPLYIFLHSPVTYSVWGFSFLLSSAFDAVFSVYVGMETYMLHIIK